MDVQSTLAVLFPVCGWAVWLGGVALLARGLVGRRPKSAQCPRCEYPLEAHVPATCPECGRVVQTARALVRRRWKLRPVVIALAVMFGGRSLWAVPQVIEHGWIRLVPTSVLVLATPWKTESLFEFKARFCEEALPSPPTFMEDLYARAAEGRLWRAQAWLHAHLAATTAWATGIHVDNSVHPRESTFDGQWQVVYVGDILRHLDRWYADAGPGVAYGANQAFVAMCGWADDGRWRAQTGHDGRYELILDDLVAAGPPEMVNRLRAMVDELRHAIASSPGAASARGGVRTVDAYSGQERYWMFLNVSDLVTEAPRVGVFDGHALVRRLRSMVEPNVEDGSGDIANLFVLADVLVIWAPADVIRAAERAIDDLRRR